MLKKSVLILVLAIACPSLAAPKSKTAKSTKVSTKKTYKGERAPAGVATELPSKYSRSSTSTGMGMSESRMAAVTSTPDSKRPLAFSAAAELVTGNVDTMFKKNIKFTQLVPQMNVEVKDLGTAYMNIPLTQLNLDDYTARTIGRPQFGVVRELINQEGLAIAAHANLQLPLYDSSRYADDPATPGDAGRSWGFAAGGSGDMAIPQSPTHIVGAAQLSYDTPSKVMYNGSNMNITNPVALRTSLGVNRNFTDKLIVGVGLRSFYELYNAQVSGGGLDGNIPGLDVTQGEITGSYALLEKTRLHAGIVKGLKTAVDPLRYPLVHHARDIADLQFSVSMLQTF
ncbi:MAG: hypothetical protein SGI74_02820 [Oligoflexia bacterium]|nr:hypothetical protein [Oligoflexia bacterium]